MLSGFLLDASARDEGILVIESMCTFINQKNDEKGGKRKAHASISKIASRG
jgi:hypothetical protein